MRERQNLARALESKRKIGSKHTFLRDNYKVPIWKKKMPYIVLYFKAF